MEVECTDSFIICPGGHRRKCSVCMPAKPSISLPQGLFRSDSSLQRFVSLLGAVLLPTRVWFISGFSKLQRSVGGPEECVRSFGSSNIGSGLGHLDSGHEMKRAHFGSGAAAMLRQA